MGTSAWAAAEEEECASLSALSAICSALKDSLNDQIKVLIKDILLG